MYVLNKYAENIILWIDGSMKVVEIIPRYEEA